MSAQDDSLEDIIDLLGALPPGAGVVRAVAGDGWVAVQVVGAKDGQPLVRTVGSASTGLLACLRGYHEVYERVQAVTGSATLGMQGPALRVIEGGKSDE